MSANFRLKVLAGAIAWHSAARRRSQTRRPTASPTGDLFLNIVDTNNNTSYFFDTGVSQASFSGTGSYSFNIASDPNYTAFEAGIAASDTVDYSVLSATKTTAFARRGHSVLHLEQRPDCPERQPGVVRADDDCGRLPTERQHHEQHDDEFGAHHRRWLETTGA